MIVLRQTYLIQSNLERDGGFEHTRYRAQNSFSAMRKRMPHRVWQCVWAKLFQNAACLIARQAARRAILNGLLTHRIIVVMMRRRERKFNHDLSNRNAFYSYI